MNKNILIGLVAILFVACLVEGYFVMRERNEKNMLGVNLVKLQQENQMKANTPAKGPKPMLVLKGQVFADNPMSQKAYLIYPVSGALSADAQTALTGWTVQSKANADGTTQVDLIPKEAEDVKQSFTLKTGYKLYFIELTLSDDTTGVDENRGDDIGVLVDDKGIVQ